MKLAIAATLALTCLSAIAQNAKPAKKKLFCFFGGCTTQGLSAYDIAVKNGFKGTEVQWLASLKGKDGINGKDGVAGINGQPGLAGKDGISPTISMGKITTGATASADIRNCPSCILDITLPSSTSQPTPPAPTPTPVPVSTYSTWFIRPDGGTRYSSDHQPFGQCDGLHDAPYPGSGTNQPCAFNDLRSMVWNNTWATWQWIMKGGDTLVIRGCKENDAQTEKDAPHCRIGFDSAYLSANYKNDDPLSWGWGVQSLNLPSPPSGPDADHKTKILGGCAFGTYSCTPVSKTASVPNESNLTQIFATYGSNELLALNGSKHIELEGLELTTHNGQCARFGDTNGLPRCNSTSNAADQGISTDTETEDVHLQDVALHGFNGSAIGGPIGGKIKLDRVSMNFNTFAGWNFDQKDSNGISIPNKAGSSIEQSEVTMIGNGCQEEYPIVHKDFPAKGCWDTQSGGFGDAWSGQESALDSFTCDKCFVAYNTKDGAIGPHTQIANISLTNSTWIGNMGQSGKWGQRENAKFVFSGNTLIGNSYRMSQPLPGAAQNFDVSTGLVGSGLSNYGRAAGALFAYFSGAGSQVEFSNNTVITYQPTIFQLGCFLVGTCKDTPYVFSNNKVVGVLSKYNVAPYNSGSTPGLFYTDDPSVNVHGTGNNFFGVRNDSGLCAVSNNCTNNPIPTVPASVPPENALDSF